MKESHEKMTLRLSTADGKGEGEKRVRVDSVDEGSEGKKTEKNDGEGERERVEREEGRERRRSEAKPIEEKENVKSVRMSSADRFDTSPQPKAQEMKLSLGVGGESGGERKYITLGPETARSTTDKLRTPHSLHPPHPSSSLTNSASHTFTSALLSPRSHTLALSPPGLGREENVPFRNRSSTTTTSVKKKTQIRNFLKFDTSSTPSSGHSLLISPSSVTPNTDGVTFVGAGIGYGDLSIMLVNGQKCLMSKPKKLKELKSAVVALCRLDPHPHILSVYGLFALSPSPSPSDPPTHIVTEYADGNFAKLFPEKSITLSDRMILCAHIVFGECQVFRCDLL